MKHPSTFSSRSLAPDPRRGRRWLAMSGVVLALSMLPGVPGLSVVGAPSAQAGEVDWSFTVGSGGRASANVHYRSGHSRGHYQSVWRPAVYQTRYDACGRAYQVCVRAGYYDRVYVPASSNHYGSGRHGYDHYSDSGYGHGYASNRYDTYRSDRWGYRSNQGWRHTNRGSRGWYDDCSPRSRRGRY